MQFDFKKEKISAVRCVAQESTQQNVDLEINLPDYCSDIKRVLRCFVIPQINSVQVTGDRASVKGEILIRLVYVGEGEKIDCYEQSVDLSKYIDIRDMPEGACVRAFASTQYVNCRAASQRRFVVSGSVSVTFSVYSKMQKTILQRCEDSKLETKCENLKAVCSDSVFEKTFDLSETASLDENQKSIGKIINTSSSVTLESAKAVSGKILLKGELKVCVLYCADTKEAQLEHINHTMPISQIVETGDVDDSFNITIEPDVRMLIVNAKTDSSGQNRLLEISAKVSAFIRATKEDTVSYISDCYCTCYESSAKYETFDFYTSLGNIAAKKSAEAVVDLSGQSVKEIVDIKQCDSTCSVSSSGDKCECSANVVFAILLVDSKGRLQYLERNAQVSFDAVLKESFVKISCDALLETDNITAEPMGEKLKIKFDCSVLGEIYSVNSRRILEEVSADENAPKQPSEAAITLYYCSKGESVWEIAKRYNSSEKKIEEENGVKGTVEEDMMLII